MGTLGPNWCPILSVTTKFVQFVLLFVLTAVMGVALACSAPAEKTQNDEIAAALKDFPDGITNRFVLMVSTEKDGQVNPKTVATVVAVLRDGGAEKVESLEGSPIIFVTCKTAAIYKALETGLLSSVQVDKLSKPQ